MRGNVSSGHMFLSLESCSDIRGTFSDSKDKHFCSSSGTEIVFIAAGVAH